jgi:hypothetical protein
MPDLTQLPGQQPKVFGAPLGPAEHVAATDRPQVVQPTDEQVKLAYQAYMRQVVQAAHAHFADHLEKQKAQPAGAAPPMANPAAGPLGSGLAQKGAEVISGREQQINKAVTNAGG